MSNRTNILGVTISRPNQELVIMRGIPGAGKSTKVASLVGEGIVHSTDTLIEEITGDYIGYFTRMVESGDWSEHSKMHHRNFLKARRSMEEGVSPVIIDNTNIKASEPKKYVEAALNMGFDENNIKIVDIGTGGCTAEVLAERNTHNVPLKTIERMMASHQGVGELTVTKILKSKDMSRKAKIAMLVLDEKSRSKLLGATGHFIPEGWKVFAHHMTINFGKGLPKELVEDLGTTQIIKGVNIGKSDMAIAIGVEGYHSDNDLPHITLGINIEEGGKPKMSNDITEWNPLENYINLTGTIVEEYLN